MTYTVVVLRRAQGDVIYDRLAQRSITGAERCWYQTFRNAADSLRTNPTRYSEAPEAASLGYEIRQHFFKTPRGRAYRLLYLVASDEVRVLRVRGPGQTPLASADLPHGPY
jgi:plasmid stabilization system protein ParE